MGASGYLIRVGVLGVLMLAMVALDAAVAPAKEVPDASCQDTNTDKPAFVGLESSLSGANWTLAQTFTAQNSGLLTTARVSLVDNKADATGTVVMEIRTVDASGYPSANVLASTSKSASEGSGYMLDPFFQFSRAYGVAAGRQYALVLRSSDDFFSAPASSTSGASCSGMLYMGKSTTGNPVFPPHEGSDLIFFTSVDVIPVTQDDAYSAAQSTPLRVGAPGLLSNDSDAAGDALTAVEVADPAHGEVFVNANGSFAYFPDEGYVGTDSFTYKASDGALRSGAATVEIAVKDTTEPTVSAMSPRHASTTRDTTPTIRATVKDNTPLAQSNIQLYVAGRLISATKYSYTASTGALVHNSPRLSSGKKTVKVVATDAAGNALTKSWYFTIKR